MVAQIIDLDSYSSRSTVCLVRRRRALLRVAEAIIAQIVSVSFLKYLMITTDLTSMIAFNKKIVFCANRWVITCKFSFACYSWKFGGSRSALGRPVLMSEQSRDDVTCRSAGKITNGSDLHSHRWSIASLRSSPATTSHGFQT